MIWPQCQPMDHLHGRPHWSLPPPVFPALPALGVFREASGDHSWPGSTRHYCCSLWGARGHTQVKCVLCFVQGAMLCSLFTVQSCTLLYFQATRKLRAGHQLYGTQAKHGKVRQEVCCSPLGWNSFKLVGRGFCPSNDSVLWMSLSGYVASVKQNKKRVQYNFKKQIENRSVQTVSIFLF